MAIHAYVGKPGSGKSYSTVEHVVIPSLKQGRHVVTNIPLNADMLLSEFGGSITQIPLDWHESSDISEFFPAGCVAIMDECWRRWPAGESINKANPIDKALLAEHRHRVDSNNNSMRIVLVTQDLSQISSWVRSLIETTYRTRKFTKKIFKVEIYSGAVTGESPPKSKLMRRIPGKFDSKVFGYYQSATQSTTGDVGDESSADTRSNVFKSPGFWISIVLGIVVFWFCVSTILSFLTPPESEKPNDPVKSTPAVARAPEPPISTKWRIVGFVHPSRSDPNSRAISEPLALITDGSGSSRYIPFSDCRYFPGFTEVYCIVDGAKVTSWSLRRSNALGEFIGAGR